jgi:signal transduction histidine kinase
VPARAVALGVALALAGLGTVAPALDPGPASPFRHLYVVPVLGAGLAGGALGGALAAVAAVLLQVPRLFAHLEDAGLTPLAAEDLMSAGVLLAMGPLVGALAGAARQQRARYETLLAVQRALALEAPLPDALARVRAALSVRVGGDALALVVRDGPRLVLAGAQRVAAGSPAARVLATGRPLFVADTGQGRRPRRALVVPLLTRGEMIGVLAVERAGELRGHERAALEGLGAYLGLALENARLLSRQRRFTEELKDHVAAATRRLEALDGAKSAFVATVSHELRTPLTALLGFGQLLATRRYSPEEAQRLAGIVWRETERLTRIVDDLLDLSRIERGLAPRILPTAVAVIPALGAAVELFRRGRVTHHVVVAAEETLPAVQADPDALDRVLKNLISNAIKYSPAGSRVTVSARAAGRAVEFAVTDEGRGIPAQALSRIFEPYYRAPEAAEAARGDGLGLAVVKALVDAQGGAIRADSVRGQGTRMTFTLPAVQGGDT